MWSVFIASVLGALAVSAICSLLEAVVLSYTPTQVARLAGKHPSLARIWQEFKTHIDRPIAVILILNTAAHTIGATVAGAQFERLYPEEGIAIFSIIFTFLMLQFTEILPKSLGVRYAPQLAPIIAYPLSLVVRVFTPVIWLVHLINRPFEGRRQGDRSPATIEEITALAGLARISNLIGSHEERIIRGASRLSAIEVREVMIPADQVTFLSTDQSINEAIIAAHMDPHTRFPICEHGDRNHVVGYINFKELIYHARTNPSDQSLLGIIRPVYFTPPDRSAGELLKVFVDHHVHIAIVRDSDGTTLGLVTLEDVLEELVGELEDEFDRLPRMLHKLRGGTWMVGGGVPVAELAQQLGIDLPDKQGTISAWLIRRFGRVPNVNEAYKLDGTTFMVRRTRRGKIFEVSVTVSQEAAKAAE